MAKKIFQFDTNNFIYFVFPLAVLESFFLWFLTAPNHVLDFSYLIVGFLAVYLFFTKINTPSEELFFVNKNVILLNLFLVFSYFLLITYVYDHHELMCLKSLRFFLMTLAVLVIFTSFISFVNISCLKNYKLESFLFLPLTFMVSLYPTLNSIFWIYLSSSTCKIVIFVFSLLGYKNVALIGDYTLMSPSFSISIRPACSGLEGISFLVTIFSFYLLLEFYKNINIRHLLFSYFAAVIYMYFLNVIRISLYFVFGFSMVSKFGSEKAVKSTIGLFHSNVGWIVYFLGILVFVCFWKYVSRKLKFI